MREREDATASDTSPVPVSNLVDDGSGQPDETQANKNPKTNKKETPMERGNAMIAQQRGMQLYQTRSLPADFIEKALCMKTKDQLYQRESVILRPRVVPRANPQSGSQDLPVQEAISSWESQQDAESYGEKPEATLLTTEYLVSRSQR